jgi:sec-independent protein translocase protein TatA
MGSMSIWHWLIVGIVVMLLFGKGRLSDFMGDAAKGIKAFKKGMNEDDGDQPAPRPAARLQGQPPLEPASDRDLQPMKDDRPAA